MTSLLRALAEHLASRGVGVIGAQGGWSIAVGALPVRPASALALVEAGGAAGDDEPDVSTVNFIVRVRALQYAQAVAKHAQVRGQLWSPLTLGAVRIIGMTAAAIEDEGRDGSQRHLLAARYHGMLS